MPTIDYFFTLVSPFAYLGHRAFLDVAREHGAEVRFRPALTVDCPWSPSTFSHRWSDIFSMVG